MTQVPTIAAPPLAGLLPRVRVRIAALHAQAERSGVIAAILAGTVSRWGYTLYLRNLLPAYQAMERLLRCHAGDAGIGHLALPPVYRADRIATDLDALAGGDWAASVPLLPAGAAYAERIQAAGRGDGARLVAHAYTRYLADLNGGQVLRTRLIRTFGADFSATAFAEFPDIADRSAFIMSFHAALARAAGDVEDADQIIEEAAVAFELNIRLSEEVAAAARDRSS